ncbi:MAG TPA: response regulator [Acidobacteriota bacterium]|nr:response regulator [Acidobacteriota bacterium]
MKRILVVDDDRSLRHVLCSLLETAGYNVTAAGDGVEALKLLNRKKFNLVLLDIGLPLMSGLEILSRLRKKKALPKIVVMTADDTPETVLSAVRDHAYRYIGKPFAPNAVVDLVGAALSSPPAAPPIEVLSARPEWVELLVPCDLESVERIQTFLERLKADLPEHVRESVGRAFRELLLNAVEWGGKLDPRRKVRIAYLRARRMLMYRIADPGDGFSMEALAHAAVNNPQGKPFQHAQVRERKGIRPGGFGILMVKAMVDELIYNEARNEVVFVKYLD